MLERAEVIVRAHWPTMVAFARHLCDVGHVRGHRRIAELVGACLAVEQAIAGGELVLAD
jgi:hypothetical protein